MSGRKLSLQLWLCLGALLAAACSSEAEPETGVVVAVYTDLELGSELARLTARVLGEDGRTTQQENFELKAAEHKHFAVSFGVKRGREEIMRLSLTGFDAEGQAVIAQTLHARFAPQKVLLLRTLLGRRCYQQLSCGVGESCAPSTGECVPIALLDALPERGKAGDEVTSWLPEGYLPHLLDAGGDPLDAGGDPSSDAHLDAADSGDAADAASVDACGEPNCESCANMCSTGCADVSTDPQHCGECEHACPYSVCRAGTCVSDLKGPRSMEDERLWEAEHIYGIHIENTYPGRLASLVALVSRPDPSAAVRMALFESRFDPPTPQQPVAQSPALSLDSSRVEWIIPVGERPLLYGGEKGYWLMFLLSKETYLHVDNRVRGYWRGAASVPFEPIPEVPLELEYQPHELGLPLPNLFMTIIPDPPQ